MTKAEASKILDIPLSTLNDWEKSDSNRNTLYKFIITSDRNDVESKLNDKNERKKRSNNFSSSYSGWNAWWFTQKYTRSHSWICCD